MPCQLSCHHYNPNICPFVQDNRDPNRYVCLKCGLERDINHPGLAEIFLTILGILCAIAMLA